MTVADSPRPGHPLAEAIADFLAELAQANRSAHTRRAYAGDLQQFAAWHRDPLDTVTSGVLRSFFATIAHLVNVDPDKNRYRFYQLTWQPSLFGGGAIVRRWGRIGTEGRWRPLFFASREGAQETVEEILKRRLGHGYRVVRWE